MQSGPIRTVAVAVTTRLVPASLVALVCVVVTLWIVDTVVFLNPDGLGASRNFIGMFLMHAQIACILVGMAVIGCGVTRMLLHSDWFAEMIAVICVMLLALVILACLVHIWRTNPFLWKPIRMVVALACVVTWLAVRRPVARYHNRHPSRMGTFRLLLLPPLLVAAVAQTIGRIVRGDTAVAIAVPVVLVLSFAVSIVAAKKLARPNAPLLVPLLLAILLPAIAFGRFTRYGQTSEPLAPTPSRLPDIVLIVMDTVRADHLQRYGYTRNTMPALERWASDALVMKQAFSPAGWTSPAHASIFSGAPVSIHGIHYAYARNSFRTEAFEGIRWLPEVLSDRGYHCVAVCANSLALPEEVTGFDHVVMPILADWQLLGIAGVVEYQFPNWFCWGERTRWRVPYADAQELTDMAMRAAPDDGGPLFLFVNYLDAHSPYNPPRRAIEALGVKPSKGFNRYAKHYALTNSWETLPAGKEQYLRDNYDGELRWMDQHIERLLAWIERRFGPDCIVVVTSDHGEELGEEGRVGHEYGLAQRLTHVPLFLRAPELGSGERRETMTLRSLYRFFTALAGGDSPNADTLFAQDEFGLFSERYPSLQMANLLGDDGYARPWIAMVEGRYKGVGPSDHGFRLTDVDTLGFNHDADAINALVAELLREKIDSYWTEFQDDRELSSKPEPLTDAERRSLRSLGYIK